MENFNDGRRKTFFCLAVNLLELSDLKMVLTQIEEGEKLGSLSLKERAACVAKLFQDVAGQRQITLKLRKKKAGEKSYDK